MNYNLPGLSLNFAVLWLSKQQENILLISFRSVRMILQRPKRVVSRRLHLAKTCSPWWGLPTLGIKPWPGPRGKAMCHPMGLQALRQAPCPGQSSLPTPSQLPRGWGTTGAAPAHASIFNVLRLPQCAPVTNGPSVHRIRLELVWHETWTCVKCGILVPITDFCFRRSAVCIGLHQLLMQALPEEDTKAFTW